MELERTRNAHQIEHQRKMDELMEKKRQANLKYEADKRKIEMESQQIKDTHALKMQLDQLAIENKKITAAFEKILNENEIRWKETCRKYEEQSKDLEHRRNEYNAEMEKKELELQLKLKEQSEQQKLKHEEMREKQSQEHSSSAHKLDLRLKEEQKTFEQEIEKKKVDAQIEIDKEFASRIRGQVKAIAPTGAKMTIQFHNDINPELIKILLAMGLGQESLALQPQLVPQRDMPLKAGDCEESSPEKKQQ